MINRSPFTYRDSISLTHLPLDNLVHFSDDILRYIFVNEKFCILVKISQKFAPLDPIDNNPALV